jgi:uncharacterized membrane protein YccC
MLDTLIGAVLALASVALIVWLVLSEVQADRRARQFLEQLRNSLKEAR